MERRDLWFLWGKAPKLSAEMSEEGGGLRGEMRKIGREGFLSRGGRDINCESRAGRWH
jgi:hypothetical protein